MSLFAQTSSKFNMNLNVIWTFMLYELNLIKDTVNELADASTLSHSVKHPQNTHHNVVYYEWCDGAWIMFHPVCAFDVAWGSQHISFVPRNVYSVVHLILQTSLCSPVILQARKAHPLLLCHVCPAVASKRHQRQKLVTRNMVLSKSVTLALTGSVGATVLQVINKLCSNCKDPKAVKRKGTCQRVYNWRND